MRQGRAGTVTKEGRKGQGQGDEGRQEGRTGMNGLAGGGGGRRGSQAGVVVKHFWADKTKHKRLPPCVSRQACVLWAGEGEDVILFSGGGAVLQPTYHLLPSGVMLVTSDDFIAPGSYTYLYHTIYIPIHHVVLSLFP